MKKYGTKFATEFTPKQVGVVYRLAKQKDLSVETFVIRRMYDLADYFGYDDNRSVADEESYIKGILSHVFDNDLEAAQKAIDEYTERTWNLMGAKARRNADRNYV